MKETSINDVLAQAGDEQIRPLFKAYFRGKIREALLGMMEEEAQELCGPRYRPDRSRGYRRGGSDEGTIYLGGKEQKLKRPRVRQSDGEGKEQEVGLRIYQQARRLRHVEAEVAECMAQGMSTRSFKRMGMDGMSRSEVSRRWVAASARGIEDLRGRDLSKQRFFGLILDGVFLTSEIVVVVAVGLCTDGSKQVLDFEVGSTESYEVCRDLLRRLTGRGFRVEGRLFALLDGAPALEKAVLELWPQAAIQRCLVHKERNLHVHLRHKDRPECSRLMKNLRRAEGPVAGREALQELKKFLAPRNQAALQSMEEAGERLITLHLLGVPSTLNTALLSTNLIENVIRNYRRQTDRVGRWSTQGDQVERWTATALLWAEPGFRKIRGYEDLPKLLDALGFPPVPPSGDPASPRKDRASSAAELSRSLLTSPVPEPDLSRSAFLPQREVGDKNAAITPPPEKQSLANDL